jgi:hypothetical protein
MRRKITREDILRDWPAGEYLYKAPDHVPGTHPAETGDVTWHTWTQLSAALKRSPDENIRRQDQALREEGAE